jgi:hypothetical protein
MEYHIGTAPVILIGTWTYEAGRKPPWAIDEQGTRKKLFDHFLPCAFRQRDIGHIGIF